MGWIGCVRREKLRRVFVARTFAVVRNILPQVSQSNRVVANAPKQYETHQNMSLGSNGGDRVCLSQIQTRFRGTNFCTSWARFAPSFVRQPNGPECTQIVRNTPKCQFRVQWGGSGAFIAKNLTRLRGTNFCTSSARFVPSFVRQPNGPECTQMEQNAPKRQFRVQWGGSGAFNLKNSDATSWHEFYTSSACLAPSFVRQPNGPECTQIVRNAPKH